MPARVTQTPVEVLRSQQHGSRATQVGLEVLRVYDPGSRATQQAVEVLRQQLHGAHVSQLPVEVLRAIDYGARATQQAVEVLRQQLHGTRATQQAVEVLRTITFGGRVTQQAVEVLREASNLGAGVTQQAVEVLRVYQHGARVTQQAVEVLWVTPTVVQNCATQVAVEVLRSQPVGVFATQLAVEVLRVGDQFGSRVTQLPVEVLRTIAFGSRLSQQAVEVLREQPYEAMITQAVGEVLRASEPTTQYTDDAPPWPFKPNAAFDLTETYGYLGEVLRAGSGSEQRRLLRATASGQVVFTCTLTTARELQYAEVLFADYIGQPIGVPLWQYKRDLATDHDAGATEIDVDVATGGVPYYTGAHVLLWADPFTWEMRGLLDVHADSLELGDPLVRDWPAGSALVPVVIGYLREREEQGRFSPALGEHEVTFDVPAFFP